MKAIIAGFAFIIGITPQVSAGGFDHVAPPWTESVELEPHNCRLWGSISSNMPDGILFDNLVALPNSFKYLSQMFYTDGWGFAWYPGFGRTPRLVRSELRAYSDPSYGSQVAALDTSNCAIVLGHIRYCTSGCCCHGCQTIENPHPFVRAKNGRQWSFAHNGRINKSILLDLIGPVYLNSNPPTGSGVPECDPADPNRVIDSELLFILLLKHIEQNGWNVSTGLREGLSGLIYREPDSELNFVLSNGFDLWAFKKANTLFYKVDTLNNFSAAASEFPSFYQERWLTVPEYQLIRLRATQSPESHDLRADLPPIAHCPGDTALFYVAMRPTCLGGFWVEDPDDNIETITVNIGVFDGNRLCFNPVEGVNAIVFGAVDSVGGSSACTTYVNATLTEPGFLAGAVRDSSGAPAPGTQVTLLAPAISAITDSSGVFAIDYIVPGTYDIRFHHPTLMDTTAHAVSIAANDTVKIEITLRSGCQYVRGDANGSGSANGIDVTYCVSYLKGIGSPPANRCSCPFHGLLYAAADANGNCQFNGIDVTYMVAYLKGLGPPPAACPDCRPIG